MASLFLAERLTRSIWGRDESAQDAMRKVLRVPGSGGLGGLYHMRATMVVHLGLQRARRLGRHAGSEKGRQFSGHVTEALRTQHGLLDIHLGRDIDTCFDLEAEWLHNTAT